jgi:hypothetical protein
MAIRLTSFLSSIESALLADETVLQGGTWENSRTINYSLGLARCTLGSRRDKASRPLGTILLQSFDLGNGRSCLRANLAWAEADGVAEKVVSIFERPEIDWTSEAAQVAQAWLSGPPALAETTPIGVAAEAAAEPALAVAS